MSGHTLSAIGLFIGVAAIALASQQADNNLAGRSPSTLSKKEMLLGEVTPPLLRHTQKIHGPLEAHIELIGAVPENSGDVFVLKGHVSSSKDLRDVEFKWAIPAGLEVVNGTANGYISILNADQPAAVQITLRTLASENYQVHLITAGVDGKVRFAESAQYNTLLQGMIDQSKEAQLKSTEKAVAEETKGLKVFH